MKKLKLISIKRLILSLVFAIAFVVIGTVQTQGGSLHPLYEPSVPNARYNEPTCTACAQVQSMSATQSYEIEKTYYNVGWPIGYQPYMVATFSVYLFLDFVVLYIFSYGVLTLLALLYTQRQGIRSPVAQIKPLTQAQTPVVQVPSWNMTVLFVLLGGLLGGGTSIVAALSIIFESSGITVAALGAYVVGFVLALPLILVWRNIHASNKILSKRAVWCVLTPFLICSFLIVVLGRMNAEMQSQPGQGAISGTVFVGGLIILLLAVTYGVWAIAMGIALITHYVKYR